MQAARTGSEDRQRELCVHARFSPALDTRALFLALSFPPSPTHKRARSLPPACPLASAVYGILAHLQSEASNSNTLPFSLAIMILASSLFCFQAFFAYV